MKSFNQTINRLERQLGISKTRYVLIKLAYGISAAKKKSEIEKQIAADRLKSGSERGRTYYLIPSLR